MIIRSNGEAAYIAGDIAYYLDKRERGFDRVVIMLGADHHGYIGRMMAICAAFGDTPGVNLEILIGQLVNLVKDGKPVRMAKRAGNVVTIDDLVDAVGVDAARYALARSSADSMIDLDLDLSIRTRSGLAPTPTGTQGRPSPATTSASERWAQSGPYAVPRGSVVVLQDDGPVVCGTTPTAPPVDSTVPTTRRVNTNTHKPFRRPPCPN